ncbi:gliding motility-associated-like protein [Nonlabens dokdonensis]|uniref:Gliding motility-associated-like protein n=1 Tax=Nonlabens dokdonensis TaxID=328515 RepID=A0ABX5PVW2_9FLAO|nr:choice-of-anchor L domain-containing protein [Nonlabens dokdonensis]PZX39017.1 gliding motility-associated-like protein [Nonlabens dokdonensis]
MNSKIYCRPLLYAAFLLLSFQGFSQLINTSTSLPVDQLVQQALGNDCVEITNITSNINGSVDGLNSFGSFSQGASAFPFTDGFFLSTGDGNRIGNNIVSTDLSDGTTAWTGDSDLESLTGISNTVNATVIEFDLISTSNRISFNYLLASEEYQQNFPCNVGDRFALLLRPLGGTYQNIAVLPGTSTPVGIDTVHPVVVGQCPATNPNFFAGQSLGDTNFEGRTVTLTAAANVVPNTTYHLKMVIADQSSFDPTAYDSAIFIEAGSLQADVDLGPDLFPCADATLDASIANTQATFRWFRDNIEIIGQTNSTLLADTTGTYRVEISVALPGSNCIITDDVVVTIDPNQLNINIADQERCDDASADGFESFDLITLGTSALTQLPTGNYTAQFYGNQTDAQNEVNELADNYTNTSNPQTIFIRINDLNTGCQSIRPVNLIVSDVLVANDVSYTTCDNDQDGIVATDLSQFDSQVTTSTSNVSISYHLTQNDAINNSGSLFNPYTNFGNPDTIFARISSNLSGCFATSEITINVELPPVLDSDFEFIDACDTDNDGFATFNLTGIIPEFTTSTSNSTISYHLSQQDAENDVNPITNPSAFNNTNARIQTIFIRFESNTNGCATVVPVQLFTNLLLDRTNIRDFIACDDISNDGIEEFGMDIIATTIINGLDDVTIEFFETQMDQMADVNQIDPTMGYFNTSNPQTIYIRINSPTCTEFAEFLLIVEPYFESAPIPDQTYCDEDQDLFTFIPLNEFDDAVRGTFGQDHNVLYYLSQADADNRFNPITSIFNNTNPVTVYAELIAPTGCSDVQSLDITVLPAPVAGTPNGFIICDTDQDGFFIVDLTSQEAQITTDANRSISYHNDFFDAELGLNPITNPSNYNAQTETVFIRVENTITGCETIVSQPIIVNTLPIFPAISVYQLCETDGNNVEDFFFFTRDTEILNGQAGKVTRYFTDLVDADSGNNEIDKFTAYQNISDPQTIWVRVENISDPSCFGVDSFQLVVDEAPTYNAPSDIRICDDNNDGVSTMDLQLTINEIRQGITSNLNVSFHESIFDAEINSNALPINFTNTSNPQTIYARVGNDVNCFEVEDILINVIDSPITNAVTASTVCDDDLDGFNTFDLTSREAEIVGTRPFNSTLSWHTSIANAESDLNPITNDTSFTNTVNPQTVYLRFFNTISQCFAIEPLELIVNLPPQLNDNTNFAICDNPNAIANLNDAIPQIISPVLPTQTISFYNTLVNAQTNANSINSNYTYTSSNTTIYVRVEDSTSGCFSTASFNLQVQNPPQIAASGSYNIRGCDNNFDGIRNSNLANNNNTILNALNPANHTVQYFTSQTDAENNTNELIDTNVTVNQQETFYVRVTETTLGCVSIGEFEAIVDPLPVADVDPLQVICNSGFVNINASAGLSGASFLWSTGETTSSINISTPGNYSVQATSSLGCVGPVVSFDVTESETAMVDFVASTNFGDPNTITVTVSGIGDYLYVLDNGPEQESNIFTNVSRGFHEVRVIDRNGCEPTPPQIVLIIDYPRFFTPNSDSFNDVWYVDGIDTFDKATFYIFDRHGKLLKSYGKNFSGWDGTYNNNPMPSSDYWFLLEIEDSRGSFKVKGHFSLKR